jgi:hypothetical protein
MSFRRRLTRWKNPRRDFREFPSVIVIRGGLPGNEPTPADVERARAEGAVAGQRFVIVGGLPASPESHAAGASSLTAISARVDIFRTAPLNSPDFEIYLPRQSYVQARAGEMRIATRSG